MTDMHLRQAIQVCDSGGIIAYPTEAVFGLGCLPFYEHAVNRILKLKHRSPLKGLILVAADVEQINEYVDFGGIEDSETVFASWPGPMTWLIPAKDTVPRWLRGCHEKLAVRVSAHPLVRSLCENLGPLVSTSANPQNKLPAKSGLEVRFYFRDNVDYIIPATITSGLNPTQIRDAITGQVIRTG